MTVGALAATIRLIAAIGILIEYNPTPLRRVCMDFGFGASSSASGRYPILAKLDNIPLHTLAIHKAGTIGFLPH